MKYLVGYGKGTKPDYVQSSGVITLVPPFGDIELEDILLIMNVNTNTVIHMKDSESHQLTEADLTKSGSNLLIQTTPNATDAANSDMIHIWVEEKDGLSSYDPAAMSYMESLHMALIQKLKLENNGTLNLDFGGAEASMETAINNMRTDIATMTAAINELAEVPDTQLLNVVANYSIGAPSNTSGWSIYSDIVSVRAIKTSGIILRKAGVDVVHDGSGGVFTLDAGDYLDIKFDEIDLQSGEVIVTFLKA